MMGTILSYIAAHREAAHLRRRLWMKDKTIETQAASIEDLQEIVRTQASVIELQDMKIADLSE